jgi:hypothetical protein
MSTCGLGQYRADGSREPSVVTSGDDINELRSLLVGRESYNASDVIAHLSEGRDDPGDSNAVTRTVPSVLP